MTNIIDFTSHASKSFEKSKKKRLKFYVNYTNKFRIAPLDHLLNGYVAEAVTQLSRDARILDIGAGSGRLAELLLQNGFDNIHGLDCLKTARDHAQARCVYTEFHVANISQPIALPSNIYDCIVSVGPFTSSRTGARAFDEILRLLKPGGQAILAMHEAHYDAGGFLGKLGECEAKLSTTEFHTIPLFANGTDASAGGEVFLRLHLHKRKELRKTRIQPPAATLPLYNPQFRVGDMY
jgi:SAM-dependent methyltransferase